MAVSNCLVMILAGGEGKRLNPLSRDRAKPAVPFGGKYRIIDFVLSNFVNSGFLRIKILTQFKSDSLNQHIARGWSLLSSRLNHYIDLVPAQMRTGAQWYKGTADAIYQNINLIEDENPEYVMVFGGDHIYKMDVSRMLKLHKKKQADMTIAAIPVPIEEAKEFGVIVVDKDWRIIEFQEKPDNPKPLPDDPTKCLVSMGNYVFSKEVLVKELLIDADKNESAHDFGKNIIPTSIEKHNVFAYDFSRNKVPGMQPSEVGYWRDVGNLDAFYEANMDLVSISPQLNMYCPSWPIHTHQPYHPPAKFVFADKNHNRIGYATDSLISEGCILSGGHVHHSILSPGVRVNSYAEVNDSIIMDDVNIGRYAKIKKAIIDKSVEIPEYEEIGYDLEKDRKRFFVTESGVVIIPKKTKIEPTNKR